MLMIVMIVVLIMKIMRIMKVCMRGFRVRSSSIDIKAKT